MIAEVPTGSWIVLAGALVSWYSTLTYAVLTARGKLRPSLASWGVWTATAALGTASAFVSGSTVGVVISAATCARCAQVFIPAVKVAYTERRRARAGLPARIEAEPHSATQRLLDRCCLAACALIGVIWAVTDNAELAFGLSIAVDGIACLPTIWHGLHGQEHPKPFLLGMVGPIIGLLVVRERVFTDYGWPLYELGVNIAMVLPPLVVGWPGRARPPRGLRLAAPIAGATLYAAALATVFAALPAPTGATPSPTPVDPTAATPGELAVIAAVPLGAVLVWIGALANIATPIPLIIATGRGRERPSRVSFGIWTAEASIAFAASLVAGAGIGPLLVTGATAVTLAAVLAATFIPRLRGKTVPPDPAPTWQPWVDRSCFVVCTAALIGWGLTNNPIVALLLSIVADGIACIPTFLRGWRGQESWVPYSGFFINALCAFLVITEWEVQQYAFVTYQLIVCALLVLIPLLRNPIAPPDPDAGGWLRIPPRVGHAARLTSVAALPLVILAALGVAVDLLPRPGTPAVDFDLAAQPVPAQPVQVFAAPAVAPAAEPTRVASAAIPSVRSQTSVPATPGYIELTPNGRQAWIAHRDTGVVSVLDVTTNRVVGQLRIPAGPPQFVAFCPDGRRVYVSVYSMGAGGHADDTRPHVVAVLDTATISQVAEIPVGRRPFASDCSADGATLAVPSHDDGQVDFIDTATNTVRDTLPVPANPHWITHTPDGVWWTANHESNVVTAIDPDTLGQTRIPLRLPGVPDGRSPHSIAAAPDGKTLAVVTFDSNQVWIIDALWRRPVKAIPTAGRGPQDVAWAPDGRHLYTTDVDSDVVSVVDPVAGMVTAYPGTGDAPVSVATSPDGRAAYVANLNSGTVATLDTGQPAER